MVLIEAEGTRVTRQNYGITGFNNIDLVASGGRAVEISNFDNPQGEPGVLTFTWTAQDGPAGKYDIRIAYFDEEDGESPLTFSVNGQEVGTYVFNLNIPANTPDPTAEPRNYVPLRGGNSSGTLSAEDNPNKPLFQNIDLAPGDEIQISVLADSNNPELNFERGRVDAIEITRAPSVDLFWHNPVNAQVALWTLNGQGTSVETTAFITDQSGQEVLVPENAGFEARGVIDLGDGIRNPLWRNKMTGAVGVWNMERSEFQDAIITQAPAGQPGSDLNWEIRGTGDVNRDGAEEIFWYNTSSGEIAVWEIDQNGFQNATFITDTNLNKIIISPNDPWQLVAAGDMDDDGDADAIWQNMNTQQFAYWELDGTVFQEPVLIDARPADGPWEFRGAYDANRDGIDDFFFRNSVTGQNGLWTIENDSLGQIVVIDTVPDLNFSYYV
ncbi:MULTISPECIES: FG-GAP-like repeat-containing protein [unclassified Moorena]|uniref:FG-GAP-like repeat-containing protein n=1 Tax=unclassified Moorena TaxID=2683338 RepID=UPI0013C16995|nr:MULTISPECIES: FG-GAP-like repeat-containing protein [unclassified Moorena]NEO09695.1 hypothetical protein [Moorena sp. SIO3I8]NEO18270.1 hypothetical protein [Moorena sp. SIO4A5]NEP25695.1 hypothetical protein [Moorena sp. SIO3I6]NEQ57361.1 hypothetical protein [Moorena sp. SIO4A1]